MEEEFSLSLITILGSIIIAKYNGMFVTILYRVNNAMSVLCFAVV